MIQVLFKLAPLNLELEMLQYFCSPKIGVDWNKFVYKAHPTLRNVRSKDEFKRYIKGFRNNEKESLMRSIEFFQKGWNKINDKFINALERVMETNFPLKRINMKAFISIDPINPRFLDKWAFTVFYKENESKMREIVTHEVTHLLYFKKWREVFPKDSPRTFDSPYLNWRLSEILAPVILNDLRVKAVTKINATGYTTFYKNKINGKNIIEHFTELYKNEEENFGEFLKKAKKEAEKHKDIIMKCNNV